jgi:hypothetical protein
MRIRRVLLNLLAPLVPAFFAAWLTDRERTVLDRLRAL